MKKTKGWLWVLIGVLFSTSCVTQTERLPYHTYTIPPPEPEPFYQRATRSVKETVTGWFRDDEPSPPKWGGQMTFQEFQEMQAEAIRRSQEKYQQQQNQDE